MLKRILYYTFLISFCFGWKPVCAGKEAQPVKTLPENNLYSSYKFSKDKNTINIGIQPLYLAAGVITEVVKRDLILKKKLKKSGKKLVFYSFLKGNDVSNFLLKGDLSCGIGGDMPALKAAAAGNAVITNLVQYGNTSIVAKRRVLVSTLRGKRIGYAYGSNAHYSLLLALEAEGIKIKDVRLVPMEITEMSGALKSGKIDAFSAWEPIVFIAAKHNENYILHGRLSTGFLYFTAEFYKNNSGSVKQISAGVVRALKWLRGGRSNLLKACEWTMGSWKALNGANINIDVDELADLVMKDIVGVRGSYFISADSLERDGLLLSEFEFLKGLGSIDDSSTWDAVKKSFNMETLDQILNNQQLYETNRFEYEENEDK